jgi:hypothetical protein
MRRISSARVLIAGALVGVCALSLAAAEPAGNSPERPRLVLIKVDGLSPWLLDALVNPDDPAKLARLPDPEGFRRAIAMFREQTGQRDLLPNVKRYFYEQGVRAENMFSATVTLSAVAWSVIETGQPSVLKEHMTFSRNSGYLRGHLDGFRDSLAIVAGRSRKTSALWQLDQAGVSPFADAFNPLRRYEIPQLFYRLQPIDYLKDWTKTYATAGARHPWDIFRGHMKRRVEEMDVPDFNEEFQADHIAGKILENDFGPGERYDFLTIFFSIDHQHHVDPTPENLVHRMVRWDRRIGRMLRAVERSQRRDRTLVALISDHGSEYLPGTVNVAFPITRAFRTRLFGGHTVATLLVEDAAHALSTPVPGIDFPRVYESPFSPYGKAADKGGEEDYVTAVIDNFGNARAEVHLRNNDLNRLHLLLLARHRQLNEEQRARWRTLFRQTTAELWQWLQPELASYRSYHEASLAWAANLRQRADFYWRDIGKRLKSEAERDAPQLRALSHLAELCQAEDPVAWLLDTDPSIPELIPKKYLGRRNSIYQLSHYTIGLDDNLAWVEKTVDPYGRTVPMDYFSLLSNYQAPNPPLSDEPRPTDLIVRSLPVEPLRGALVERGWLEPEVELKQVIWILSTAQHNLRRGGGALLLETPDGRLRYLPILDLNQDSAGHFSLEPHNQLDPLGLFYDPAFNGPNGEPAFLWLERFHTPQEWLMAIGDTAYNIALIIMADLTRLNAERSLANPEFQASLTGFPSEETKQRYLRGVQWKYATHQPDLLLWSSYLWNYASKNQTPGGSHGGLRPLVTRTSFLLWGGEAFHLPAGQVLKEPATTLDIVPTLAGVLGMLDKNGLLTRQAGAERDHIFLPYPGEALLPAGLTTQVAEKPRVPTVPSD